MRGSGKERGNPTHERDVIARREISETKSQKKPFREVRNTTYILIIIFLLTGLSFWSSIYSIKYLKVSSSYITLSEGIVKNGTKDGSQASNRTLLGREAGCKPLQPLYYDAEGGTAKWAAGADARHPMNRYNNTPIVIWSNEAVKTVRDRWHSVQHSKSCERSVLFEGFWWDWGLTSQIRDYVDILIIIVLTQRTTLIFNTDHAKKWCANGNWLSCFFDDLHGHQCDGVNYQDRLAVELSNVMTISTINHPHFRFRERGYTLISDHKLFPNTLWDQLLSAGEVQFLDPQSREPLDAFELKVKRKELFYYLSLSSLRSIIAREVLKLNQNIINRARSLSYKIDTDEPVVAVHLRRTDKKIDQGIAAKLSLSYDHISKALTDIYNQTGHHYKDIILLSDDPATTEGVKEYLGSTYRIWGVSNIRAFFNTSAEFDRYREEGHPFMNGYFETNPEIVRSYQATVLVDALVASYRSDFLVGVGSSGVSQLIAQLMGSRCNQDGNMMSIWEEDIYRL